LAAAAAGRALVVGVVSVVLALNGYGAWSLVWGTVAGAACYLGTTAALAGRRSGFRGGRLRRPELRAVIGYGLPVAGGILLSKLIFDVDYLVVGRRLGSQELGLYTLAFRLPELAIINVFFVISSVTFPLYSKARHDPPRLRRGYLASMRAQALYGLTAGAGMAVVSPVLVPTVLGDRWGAAVAPLAALGVYAALRSLGAGANDVYKALGRPGLSVWVSLIRLAVLVPVLLVATRWGITGVAWGQALAAAAFVVLMQSLALRVLGLRWREFGRAVAPGAVTALAAAGAAALVVAWSPGGPAAVLALAVVAGGAVALVTTLLTAPELLATGTAMIRRRTA
jgi:PST family polysaccharide transporter